ncbi:MAG: BTAD domain-containing putative transcriptional regulator [Chloroflexota bacterium]
MSQLAIQLLGGCQISVNGEPTPPFESDKVRALLIYLAVESDRPHSREHLAGLLWPDYSEQSARTNLRRTLSSLRRTVADQQTMPPFLKISRQAIQFNVDSRYWLDTDTFTKQEATGLAHVDDLLTLYKGAFLDGFSLSDSDLFEAWQLLKQEQFHRHYLRLLQQAVDSWIAKEDYAQACDYAQRLVDASPWQEDAHAQLIRLLALNGQRSAALEQFERCQQILHTEVGVDPTPDLLALVEAIRQGQLGLSRAFTPTLTASNSPPLRNKRYHNLPTQLTPFIGRSNEVTDTTDMFHSPNCRLLTLLGPGGIGKTRLALAVAESQLTQFADGVYFVELAAVNTLDGLLATTAQALRFNFYDGLSPREQLLDFLREKTMLLLFDNFEQLLFTTEFVLDLLEKTSDTKILITSRTRLNVQAEHIRLVEGLSYPSLPQPDEPIPLDKDWTTYPALALFNQTAQRIVPDFSLSKDNLPAVIKICMLVDGMPLGIVLAASWIELLSPDDILTEIEETRDFLALELDDLPPRQRSLRAIFDYSWKHLTNAEQTIFSQVCLFQGGFTRQACQAVTRTTLTTILRLVNKSFLQKVGKDRFQIHESLRWYGQNKLIQSPILHEETQRQHADYFLAFLRTRGNEVKGQRQKQALREMEIDWNNIRSAWDYALAQQQFTQLLDAAEGLGIFYEWQGRYDEGETICQQADLFLANTVDIDGLRLRIRLKLLQAMWSQLRKNIPLAEKQLQQSKTLLHHSRLLDIDLSIEKAFFLLQRGQLENLANYETATTSLLESLSLYHTLDEPWWEARVLSKFGGIAAKRNADQDINFLEESLSIRRRLGDQWGLAEVLERLGFIAVMRGDFETGSNYMSEATSLIRENRSRADLLQFLNTSALTHMIMGEFSEGYQISLEAVHIQTELGNQGKIALGNYNVSFAALFLGRYEEAQSIIKRILKANQNLEAEAAVSYALWQQGRILLAQRKYQSAYNTLQKSVDLHKKAQVLGRVYDVVVSLGVAAYHLNQYPEAKRNLFEALAYALDNRLFFTMMRCLLLAALIELRRNNPVVAVELYSLALQNPHIANSPYYEDIAGKFILEASASLDPETIAAAQRAGQARDIWQTGAKILAVLKNDT